jgi:hypothetical protein
MHHLFSIYLNFFGTDQIRQPLSNPISKYKKLDHASRKCKELYYSFDYTATLLQDAPPQFDAVAIGSDNYFHPMRIRNIA